MKHPYPPKVQKAIDALLNNPAVSTPTIRQAIVKYTSALSLGADKAEEIPMDLIAYVDKVTMHAYKVTDQDVQHLKEAGYSEDAIFEITLCASLGASLARFECGLQALKGSE